MTNQEINAAFHEASERLTQLTQALDKVHDGRWTMQLVGINNEVTAVHEDWIDREEFEAHPLDLHPLGKM